MKFLVTGGAGFIGSHMVGRLVSPSIEFDKDMLDGLGTIVIVTDHSEVDYGAIRESIRQIVEARGALERRLPVLIGTRTAELVTTSV